MFVTAGNVPLCQYPTQSHGVGALRYSSNLPSCPIFFPSCFSVPKHEREWDLGSGISIPDQNQDEHLAGTKLIPNLSGGCDTEKQVLRGSRSNPGKVDQAYQHKDGAEGQTWGGRPHMEGQFLSFWKGKHLRCRIISFRCNASSFFI